ncbi:hypothetical protein NC653_000727 [Populus alba x Populus x berolinensis]|uniref:Uncharacterized protein n=1 Tax=Populus alba x Populus x berolinensis TaxID=444605 RepID=A0AAD6RJL7_9ROSI|nr:hypothetical protein NC653_000727 [Populus alba x Populus x berolinensis]
MKQVCRRERESRWLLGGCAGFLWWSLYFWWYVGRVCWYSRRRRQLWKRRRDRKKNKCAETGRKTGFLADFGPDSPFPQAMKSTSIYRRWKRAILSTLRKNFSL